MSSMDQKWLRVSHLILTSLLVWLTASSAHAESPQVRLRPIAPGAIAIDWEHSFDSADSITVEREAPANTWTFVAMVNTFTDLGLQPSRTYRYRVCAVYDETRDCDIWREVMTLATPEPFTPPAVPRFISSSATTTSIVVNWASSSSYSFHQVRWAENGHGDGQNRVNGRSFSANGLRPGTTYHFIVQGCNRTLFGSSCSRFTAPIGVTTRVDVIPPAVPQQSGIIYTITDSGDLLWNRHDGRQEGTFRWALSENRKVGVGWSVKQAFSGGDGIIYAVMRNGDLLWNRHDGRQDGTFRWAVSQGKQVGNGWSNFSTVFAGGEGVIYAIAANGDLVWYRHDGRQDGTARWAFSAGKKVGTGWSGFSKVFAGGDGVIYAIAANGDLLWYRHDGWRDGSFRWASNEGKKVGNGWNHLSAVFSGGDGVIYAITAPSRDPGTGQRTGGDLLWNRHDGRIDGTFRWALSEGKKVGHRWNVEQVFSDANLGH